MMIDDPIDRRAIESDCTISQQFQHQKVYLGAPLGPLLMMIDDQRPIRK